MKAIKRTVAALLATLMLATSTSFTLAAENYTDDEAVVVAKVNAAGIMQGTDKGFEPSKSLTRAEAAAIIVRMKGISESAVKTAAGTTLFNDVAASHWASGYVNQASNLGIVKGVSATEFAPDREVTVAEFVTMAVRALGAGTMVDTQGTWPINYVNFANEEGLLDEVPAIYTAVASRLNAATIVANTLEAPMWAKTKATTNNEVTWEKQDSVLTGYKTILSDTLNILVYENVFLTTINTKDRKVAFKDGATSYSYDVADGVDMASLKSGIEYDVWYNNSTRVKEVVGIWKSEDSKQDVVNFTNITKVGTDYVKVTVNGSEKEYDFVAQTATSEVGSIIEHNGDTKTAAKGTAETAAAKATLLAGYNKDNCFGSLVLDGDDIVAMYIEEYEYAGVVEEVTSTKVKFDEDAKVVGYSTKTSLATNNDKKEYAISKNGKDIEFSNLDEGDAIFWYEDGDKYVIEVITNVVEGEVKAYKDATYTGTPATLSKVGYVKIDNEKYDTAFKGEFKAEQEIKAYLNAAGDVVMYIEVEDAASDVAFIKYIREIEDTYKEANYEIELWFTDGTASERMTIDLGETYKELEEAGLVAKVGNDYKYGTTTSGTFTPNSATGNAYASKEKVVFAYLTNVESFGNGTVGLPLCYEINGTKLTVLVKDDEFAPVSNETLTIGTKVSTWDSYYITKDTKFFNVKKDGSYKSKLTTYAFEDLDTTNSLSGAVIDIDDDTKEVKYVVFTDATLNRMSETNFAYIVGFAPNSVKYDGDRCDTLDVILLNGDDEIKTVIITKDTDKNGLTMAEALVGTLVDISIDDNDVVKDVDALPVGTSPAKTEDFLSPYGPVDLVVRDYVTGSRILLSGASYAVDGSEVVLADEVLVIEIDEDGEYSKASLDDISEFDADAKEIDNIISYVTYKADKDEAEEVVGIIFQNKDYTPAP